MAHLSPIFMLALATTATLLTLIQSAHGRECEEENAHMDFNITNKWPLEGSSSVDEQNGRHHRCRNRNSQILSDTLFEWDACVQCYSFMPADFFADQLCYRSGHLGALWRRRITSHPEPDNGPSPPATAELQRYFYGNELDRANMTATFIEPRAIELWKLCCERAKQCCAKMAENDRHAEVNHCPWQWDGWQCIDAAANGTTIAVVCPSHIYFYGEPPTEGCPRFGNKECFDNGTWNYRTDYSTCGRMASLRRKLHVHIGAYAASLVSLVPAIAIFHSYKQLRVPRITMHTNFFVSLVANAIAAILFMSVFNLDALEDGSDDQRLVLRNPAGCKLALTLTKYTRTCTYMWMLCEAFYLHKLIVTSFAEEKRLLFYYITGWGLPIVFVSMYAASRALWDNEPCWMTAKSHYEWILNAPMLFSLILNTVFLFKIIRGLVTKLKAANTNEPSHFRKAAKATLVLVPLFGVHYLTVLYLPHQESCGILTLYYYLSAVLDGLQGLIVSIFFCYSTSEIRMLLQRTYRRHRLQQDPRGRTFNSRGSATTQVVSVNEGSMPNDGDKNNIPLL